MKSMIHLAALLIISATLAGCHHHKKDDHRPQKSKHYSLLPGDKGVQAPNCTADGPGCMQLVQ